MRACVGVAEDGTGVFVLVGVAVGGIGVFVLVGVAVGGTGVFALVGVGVDGIGVRVLVGVGVCRLGAFPGAPNKSSFTDPADTALSTESLSVLLLSDAMLDDATLSLADIEKPATWTAGVSMVAESSGINKNALRTNATKNKLICFKTTPMSLCPSLDRPRILPRMRVIAVEAIR